MSRANETRYIKWHKKCKSKCRLDAIVCNNKQCWNKNKCICECKELIDNGICDKGFIWNPSTCRCECDKSWDFFEYLDYENCKYRKELVDKLIDECSETIEEVKLANRPVIELRSFENENNYKYGSCRVYIILTIIVLTSFTEITIYFIYHNWSFVKNNVSCIKFNTHKEAEIW